MAVVSHAARQRGIEHRIVHTGQHYDAGMSEVFFEELSIPAPDFNLGIGSASHAVQTGEMLKALEPVLTGLQPDWVLLYGDTNSTLAGAVVSSKLLIPTAHVEAGLRSFNRRMPEEINRIATDHLSDLLLCPTPAAMENLRTEGLIGRAVWTGDVMYDAVLAFQKAAGRTGSKLAEQWPAGAYALATVHRAENTDDPARLEGILKALDAIARDVCPVVFPVHPRTRKYLDQAPASYPHIAMIPPVSYLEMILLESRARFILTDSGGVQKEAYFFRRPCITLRDETEWIETLDNGCNVLAGAGTEAILQAASRASAAGPWSASYGDGDSGGKILAALADVSRTLRRTSGAGDLQCPIASKRSEESQQG
jgi:UDP-GlcNAc3NAcA epimerase